MINRLDGIAYRRTGFGAGRAFILAFVFGLTSAMATAQGAGEKAEAEKAEVRLNELGAENGALALRVGTWDVTETVWAKPGAAPVTTTGLVAERKMIGQMFQETLRSPPDGKRDPIDRIDYLNFDRVEGRWKYVSMDMRSPVGIMNAWSIERGEPGHIELLFAPFAIAGPGSESTGQLIGMTQTVRYSAADSDEKDQYFILADGSGKKWLGHRYAYVRRR